MTKAENGQQVTVKFHIRTTDGKLVGEGPQTLTLGNGEAFRLIEEAIVGMGEGEQKTLHVPSEEAFGPRSEERMLNIPRSELPRDQAPTKGMQLEGKNERGEMVRLIIVDVTDDTVVADANHPLAGVDLDVDVTLEKIAPAAS